MKRLLFFLGFYALVTPVFARFRKSMRALPEHSPITICIDGATSTIKIMVDENILMTATFAAVEKDAKFLYGVVHKKNEDCFLDICKDIEKRVNPRNPMQSLLDRLQAALDGPSGLFEM